MTRVVLAGFIALLVWLGYTQWKINTFPQQYPRDADKTATDVGIVLGASLRNGVPSPGLKERLDLALQLYKEKAYPAIIVTGGVDFGGTISEAEGMKRYLVDNGVPEQNVVLEEKATSTHENMLFSKTIMEERGWKRATIVTHHYHGARSLEIARTVGYDNPSIVTTETKVMNKVWHNTRESLSYTKWKLEKLLRYDSL